MACLIVVLPAITTALVTRSQYGSTDLAAFCLCRRRRRQGRQEQTARHS
jgi:hypothetical protein